MINQALECQLQSSVSVYLQIAYRLSPVACVFNSCSLFIPTQSTCRKQFERRTGKPEKREILFLSLFAQRTEEGFSLTSSTKSKKQRKGPGNDKISLFLRSLRKAMLTLRNRLIFAPFPVSPRAYGIAFHTHKGIF